MAIKKVAGNNYCNFLITAVLLVFFSHNCLSQPPPFLLQTTPVQQIPFYYPPVSNVFDCQGTNQGAATYQPWSSHFITPTLERILEKPSDNANLTVNFGNAWTDPIPAQPIECISQTQLRNGSCTVSTTCINMGGTVNPSTNCPPSTVCCMLPTCALIIGSNTRYGHCRPKRSCPGIFDTIRGVSVGCSDVANSPCCVAEEVNITCPRSYDQYVKALVKTFGLLNTTAVASPQRVLAWAPFLLSALDDSIGTCIFDCHKSSFLQFIVNVFSEMLMFQSGSSGFYKQFVDWKGISRGLLPASYFSYYSPYVFSKVIRNLFENYQLEQFYGVRSLLSAHRIFSNLNKEIGVPMADYTTQFTPLSWQSYKFFARFLDCKPAVIDGSECGNGQGMCFMPRVSAMMNVSEYETYCPAQVSLIPGDCDGYPPNTICCEKPYPPLKFGAHLVKNEFHDVVIAVHQINFLDPSLITDLVNVMINASAALYRATGGRAYFRRITILSQWNGTHGNATYETYRNADLKVVPEFTLPQPRALQLGTCGEPGDGVFLSQNHLRMQGSAELVAKTFALNRWGIGDEVASSPSEHTHVADDQVAGSATFRAASSCSAKVKVNYMPHAKNLKEFDLEVLDKSPPSVASFAFRPDLFPKENAEFCVTTTMPHCDDSRRHNSEPHTPHNRICNRTSTLSVILNHRDFDQTQNSPRFIGNTMPTFKFVKYPAVTDNVIAIVADFSGSHTAIVSATMLNAIISFLQIAPDEIKIILVGVSQGRKVEIQPPFAPLEPFVQPTGSTYARRDWLIEHTKNWIRLLEPTNGPRNTSVLTGIEQLVDQYLSQTNYRLKILVFSDFLGLAPSDTGLMARIKQAGYSIWPVALKSRDTIWNIQQSTEYPLYDYMQLLANSTYGRWQSIANPTDLLHWKYAMAAFIDDLNLGMTLLIEKYTAKPGGSIDISFSVPPNYSLNTSVVVNYDSYLLPVTIGGDSVFTQNCVDDYRGYQKQFRVVCHIGDLTGRISNKLTLKFGTLSETTSSYDVIAWVTARTIEDGAQDTGTVVYPPAWVDPWQNRVAKSPDQYIKGDAKLTSGLQVVFEKSEKFRFPRVYAIVASGKYAVLNCYAEYDLYMTNCTTASAVQLVTNGRMYDDGTGEDGFANDGVYTALLVKAKYNGTYSVHVHIRQFPQGNMKGGGTCYMKPAAAIVGYANNADLVAQAPMVPSPITFYKSAGSFDLIVPPDAAKVLPLGMVRVKSCGVRNVVPAKSVTGSSVLPTSMTISCDVYPLPIAARYNLVVTYFLSVSYRVADFTDHMRYGANGSFTHNNAATFQLETFLITFAMTNVAASYYYAVVWATDGAGNYATRSEIRIVSVPTNDQTTSRNNLPLVTDITTSWPQPDDMLPSAIIFSCVAGAVLALALIITITFIYMRRVKNRKMWSQDANRVFLPSMWPSPTRQHIRPQHVDVQQYHPQRPLFPPPGRRRHRHPYPNMDYMPGGGTRNTPNADWPQEMASKYFAQRRRERQPARRQSTEEIFFPKELSMPFNSLTKDGTVERQNVANSQAQAFYTRATDGVNQRY